MPKMENASSLLSSNSSATGVVDANTTVLSVYFVLTLWIILAHSTIVAIYAVNRTQTWTTFSKQIFSLSLNDMSVGVVSLIVLIQISVGKDIIPYYMCAMNCYFFLSSLCANLYHVFAICIHRAMMLVKEPTTVALTGTMINVLGWIPSFVLFAVAFALWVEDRGYSRVCEVTRIFGNQLESAIAFIGASYLIPLVCTNIVYGVTFYKLVARMKRTFPTPTANTVTTISASQQPPDQAPATTASNTSRPGMLAQKRATVTIGMLLLFFNLFSLPIIAVMCMMASGNEVARDLRLLVCNMFVLNSVISPFVYAVRVKHLGQAMANFMPCFSGQARA